LLRISETPMRRASSSSEPCRRKESRSPPPVPTPARSFSRRRGRAGLPGRPAAGYSSDGEASSASRAPQRRHPSWFLYLAGCQRRFQHCTAGDQCSKIQRRSALESGATPLHPPSGRAGAGLPIRRSQCTEPFPAQLHSTRDTRNPNTGVIGTPAYVVYRNLNRLISSRATSLKPLSGLIADPPLAKSRSSRTERFGEK
jgi:hypothetical protein